jgi:hypothetical protein
MEKTWRSAFCWPVECSAASCKLALDRATKESEMKKLLAVTAGLLTVGLFTPPASAHNGYHRSCELGERGWHYNTPRSGRVECRPRRPVGLYWSWREDGGRRGWYHSRDRRWN